jgi:hypothetical protein
MFANDYFNPYNLFGASYEYTNWEADFKIRAFDECYNI